MATDTAAAPAKPATLDPTRNIWQVPLFLLASLLFVAVWQGWIAIGPPSPPDQFLRDSLDLRNASEKISPSRDELKDLLVKVASNIDFSPDKNDAHFILGSGYAKLAELTPSSEEARSYWMLAQQHFDSIDRGNFTEKIEGAKSKLVFRNAKARVAIGLPPGTSPAEVEDLIILLENTPFGDDPGEAQRLKAELAMRSPSPEHLAVAKESLTRYLTNALSSPAIYRERCKIILADLHYRDKQMDLARKWLENIAPDALSDVVVAGKVLLARVNMAENNWPVAAREWEAVRAMPNLAPSLRATAAYQLGVCKINTHEPDAAAKLFEEACKGEDTPETSAAAFRLAEQYLKSSDPAKRVACIDLLAKAMKDIKGLEELRINKNTTLLDVNEINATFELAFTSLAKDGAFEEALKAIAIYSPIAEAGRDRELRAGVLAAWADKLKASRLEFKSKALESAKEYLAFEATQKAASAKADTLRKAAAIFMLAEKPGEAVVALQNASKLPKLPEETAGKVWVDLAVALIAAKRPDEVWPALNKAMSVASPISTQTRYNLAKYFQENQPELRPLARYLFELIAKQTDIKPEEQKYQEFSLLALGDEFIRLKDFATAELWLRQQLHTYPTGTQAAYGQLLLGISLLQLASVPGPTGPIPSKAATLRDEALRLFRATVAEEDSKLKKEGKLSEHDAWLRVQAAIRVLQAHLKMRNYNDLLYESEDLRQRYRGTIEELIILMLIYYSFKDQHDAGTTPEIKGKMKQIMLQTRDKMKELFDSLPPSAFNSSATEYTRAFWEKTFFSEQK